MIHHQCFDWSDYRGENHSPVVYYVTHADLPGPTAVKIGTTNNIARRFKQYGYSHKRFSPLILAVEDGDTSVESARHTQFRGSVISGEWFWVTEDLMSHISTLWESRLCDCSGIPEIEEE